MATGKVHFLPFVSLFDIDHWNTFKGKLPQIVDYHESSNYNCWQLGNDEETIQFLNDRPTLSGSQKELIQQGNFIHAHEMSRLIFAGEYESKEPYFGMYEIRNLSTKLTYKSKVCRGRPTGHGGGDKAQKLWVDAWYNTEKEKETGEYPFNAKANFLKAIRPKKKWRDLGQRCIGSDSTKNLGLHLRVEMDMIGHKCGKHNEHSLSKIFSDIDTFLKDYNANNEGQSIEVMNIATYRKAMEADDDAKYKVIADENLETFDRMTNGQPQSFGGRDISVVECGQPLVDKYLEDHPEEKAYDYGVILPQVINFELLVNADIFIGVRGSTYSNDIWVTRYHRGKGATNFEYTKDGIVAIENGGLPEPFDCWRRRG